MKKNISQNAGWVSSLEKHSRVYLSRVEKITAKDKVCVCVRERDDA